MQIDMSAQVADVWTIEAGEGAIIRCKMPTALERQLVLACSTLRGELDLAEYYRQLSLRAVYDWEGLEDQNGNEIEYRSVLTETVLGALPDVEAKLFQALVQRLSGEKKRPNGSETG